MTKVLTVSSSQSPSRNGSGEIATDAPVECLSPVSEQDIESMHLTSEESQLRNLLLSTVIQ